MNKAEEITTPEAETSAGAKGAAPGSRPNPTNSKAHEMASNIIAGMKGVLNLFNGNKLAVGNCEIIKENYVKIDTELNILSNIFNDNIKFKNKIFS